MTYANEEFIPIDAQEEAPRYPRAFGITFTPRVSGITLGLLGLLGAVYLLVNVVQPAWQRYQELESAVADKELQVQQQKQTLKQVEQIKADLAQAQQRNQQVLSLFASEQALDTLLLDLNTFVRDRNATLTRFEPEEEAESIVNDGSLGAAINGKLKRKTINLELEGSFDQVQSILRSFERLQSLLLIKDFEAELSEPPSLRVERGRLVATPRPILSTKFKMEALLPLTEEEKAAAAAAKPAQPPVKN